MHYSREKVISFTQKFIELLILLFLMKLEVLQDLQKMNYENYVFTRGYHIPQYVTVKVFMGNNQ